MIRADSIKIGTKVVVESSPNILYKEGEAFEYIGGCEDSCGGWMIHLRGREEATLPGSSHPTTDTHSFEESVFERCFSEAAEGQESKSGEQR